MYCIVYVTYRNFRISFSLSLSLHKIILYIYVSIFKIGIWMIEYAQNTFTHTQYPICMHDVNARVAGHIVVKRRFYFIRIVSDIMTGRPRRRRRSWVVKKKWLLSKICATTTHSIKFDPPKNTHYSVAVKMASKTQQYTELCR